MSRIGKSPVNIPSGVDVKLNGTNVTVKGPKGELSQEIDSCVTLSIEDNTITFSRESDAPSHRAKHGLYRALLQNMIQGVSEGYKKEMEVIGVGYRANAVGQQLELAFSYRPIALYLLVLVQLLAEEGQARQCNSSTLTAFFLENLNFRM